MGVLLITINSMLVSLSSVCFKLAAEEIDLARPLTVLRNKWVIFGLLLTPLILSLNILAYRFGDISALHPILQLSLIWNAFLAVIIFKEKLSRRTVIGTAMVFVGTILITLSL